MKKISRGFTLIEIAIVVVVIAILASLTLVTYNNVQMQARDTKRKNDITLLVGQFEKYYDSHGEYPTGCSRSSTPSGCQANENKVTANPDAFYANTPLAQLQAVFPVLNDGFGDPKQPENYPFGQNNYGFKIHYFYIGQYDSNVSNGTGGSVMDPSTGSEIDCDGSTWIYLSTPVGTNYPKSTTFVLAYWSEATQQWMIYQGNHGAQLTLGSSSGAKVRGTTVGKCVFMP